MPIYPIKGSTASAIQAINAGNATVSHRVARVNGFDGTANHLIYTADTPLYENGVTNSSLVSFNTNHCTGGGAITFHGSFIQFSTYNDPNTNVWSRAMLWTSNKVNLAGYSTINVTASQTSADVPFGQIWILIANNYSSTDNPQLQSWTVAKTYITSAGTCTLGLSGLQGEYFIGIMGAVDGSWNFYGNSLVSKIYLE